MTTYSAPSEATLDTPEALEAIQVAYEQGAMEAGKDRALLRLQRQALNGDLSGTRSATSLIAGALPAVSLGLQEWVQAHDTKGKGKAHSAVSPLRLLDDFDKAAFVALTAAFDTAGAMKDPRAAAKAAGRLLEDEVWAAVLVGMGVEDPSKSRTIKRLFTEAKEEGDFVRDRKAAARAKARAKLGYQPEKWSDTFCINVGGALLDVVLSEAEVFEIARETEGEGRRTRHQSIIVLTEEARAEMAEMDVDAAWMSPLFKPMLCPPKPWQDVNTGAYLTPELSDRVKLISTHDHKTMALVRQHIRDGRMGPCMTAINSIQGVAYEIDPLAYDLARWAQQENLGTALKKFPRLSYYPDPKPLSEDQWETLEPKQRKRWFQTVKKVKRANRGVDADLMVLKGDMAVAEELLGSPFYLPAKLDSRGRVYAVPSFNHQRSDHIKAMIRFAEGKPVGEDGAYWLAVHTANLGDFQKASKKPFDARIAFCILHKEEICRVADDPYGTFDAPLFDDGSGNKVGWSKADKPFQFVTACRDLAGVFREGYGYVSNLPVALDGSNSGLQHYSAALRCRAEGAMVCLTDEQDPQDAYKIVVEPVNQYIRQDAETPLEGFVQKFCEDRPQEKKKSETVKEFQDRMRDKATRAHRAAVIWNNQGGAGRSDVKRNVMTFCYSSEEYGFMTQHMTDLMDPLALECLAAGEDHPFDIDGDDGKACAVYLAAKVWQAVQVTLPVAAAGMKYLKKGAKALAHQAAPVVWTTPVGLPVVHKYHEWETAECELFLYDRHIQVSEATSKDKVDDQGRVRRRHKASVRVKPKETLNKDKQANAVSPNFIHSLDASHLMLTVNAAFKEGITNVQLIHDSFATLAADTDRFFSIIREQFVEMYETHDPFTMIHDVFTSGLDADGLEKLDALPHRGTLDLQEVTRSLYAFA